MEKCITIKIQSNFYEIFNWDREYLINEIILIGLQEASITIDHDILIEKLYKLRDLFSSYSKNTIFLSISLNKRLHNSWPTDMTGQFSPFVHPEFCYCRNDLPFFLLKN